MLLTRAQRQMCQGKFQRLAPLLLCWRSRHVAPAGGHSRRLRRRLLQLPVAAAAPIDVAAGGGGSRRLRRLLLRLPIAGVRKGRRLCRFGLDDRSLQWLLWLKAGTGRGSARLRQQLQRRWCLQLRPRFRYWWWWWWMLGLLQSGRWWMLGLVERLWLLELAEWLHLLDLAERLWLLELVGELWLLQLRWFGFGLRNPGPWPVDRRRRLGHRRRGRCWT